MATLNELIPLLKENGELFSQEEVAALSGGLRALSLEDRVAARDQNASEIGTHDAGRMLVVSGPGTGKSTLFKTRLKHWLGTHPEKAVAVATFVRKLVRDLNEDIATDESITAEEKSRVTVSTLHRLARSVVERNHGTQELAMAPNCQVITRAWEEMVWRDALSVHGDQAPDEFPWPDLKARLYDGEPPTESDWTVLRDVHVRLEQFYNALTFPDLILMATKAVHESPKFIGDTLFIIDEFQDFNLAEETFIRAMTSDSPGVLIAGDDDQVLYDRLRRGHASIIRGYYSDSAFINAMLPFCGRCRYHICCVAEAFLAAGAEAADAIAKVFVPLFDEVGAEKVRVVATTTPKSGVEYIERFVKDHEEGIMKRQDEIQNGSAKDAYLLILAPSREMKFLKPKGALDKLMDLVSGYATVDERLSESYWTLRDYYYAAVYPAQNFTLRKVLAHEQVAQPTVACLLREALEAGSNLADLEDPTIAACLEKCIAIKAILEGGLESAEQALQIEGLGGFGGADAIARDLELRPIASEADPDEDESEFEQNATVSAVDVTTVVGAKGLSADHVIVLGCDDVNFGWITRSAFFVAMTRARESLTLMACLGGGGATALHEFLGSLPNDHTQALYVKAGGMAQEFETVADLKAQLGKISYAKAMAAKAKKAT